MALPKPFVSDLSSVPLIESPAVRRVLKHIESILPYYGAKDARKHMDKTETLPHMKRYGLR